MYNVSQSQERENENLPTVRDSDLQFSKACLTPTTTVTNLSRKQRQWQNWTKNCMENMWILYPN